MSLLVRLICCRIILTASSPGRQLICRSLAIYLLVLPPLPLGREKPGVSCETWTIMVTLTHWVCFLFFLRELLMLWPPHLCIEFWRLVRLGSFPACWETGQCHCLANVTLANANVTPIPKGPPSCAVENYRPISITSVLSEVFEHLVSVRLSRFMECSGVLLTTQFAYRKGLGTCDAFLCVSHTL